MTRAFLPVDARRGRGAPRDDRKHLVDARHGGARALLRVEVGRRRLHEVARRGAARLGLAGASRCLPGSVDTPMVKVGGFPPQMSPEDVARVVVFAALDAPDAMNGSAIECFGP